MTRLGRWFDEALPAILVATGVALLLWSVLEPLYLLWSSSPAVARFRYLIGYVTIVPSCLLLIGGGRWLASGALPEEYNRTVAAFTVVGGVGFLLFNLFLMLFFPADSIWLDTNWVRWALSMGLAVGFLIGALYTRGLSETISAQRHSMRAEHVEKQRELVDHLNGILRHEVLNSAQIIQGNAQILMEAEEPIDPADERLERLHRQGAELDDVIGEVRALLTTVEGDQQLQAYRLADVVDSEVKKLRDAHDDVDVTVAVPPDVFVEADQLVGRVVGNILRNAVVHNDAADLRVAVDIETTDEAAIVTISDSGDGIPEYQHETLFERPQVGTHGLGLYLVNALMDSYGGDVEVVETGPEGTTIAVRFPLAEPPAEESEPADGSHVSGEATD
jgi:signal transduction histidine kinase